MFVIAVWLLASLASCQQTGNHPDWPRWCGKVYEAGYPNFDPGGQTVEPPKLPNGPSLHVQFKPRWSIYMSSETSGEFVVNAEISEWFGQPWPNLTDPGTAPKVYFNINLATNNDILVENVIAPGSTRKTFAFNLSMLEPRLEAYEVVFFGAAESGEPSITETSQLWYLPEKTGGSVTRLDNLNGGIHFRNHATDDSFEPLLPYGFYGSYDGFLGEADSFQRIQRYRDIGLNAMVPLTSILASRRVFEFMEDFDLKFMYDLRGYYKNLTAVREQVTAIKDFDALFGYWGSDEPDGWQDPFNGTVLSRDLIQSIDPYHPVAVTLNCQNYYFKEYSAGADIIMEDAYPIGINSTFSKWGTACNVTHGDCGCDNCQGNVQDVSRRLDDLARYEAWEGLWPKTKAHNPQSFHGEGYWLREPTVEEEVAMNALGFNHGAKGIVSWVWPTSEDLATMHGEFASVVTRAPVVEFLVWEEARRVEVPGMEILDVAYWQSGSKMMVCIVNGGYDEIEEPIWIPFPEATRPKTFGKSVWGSTDWQVVGFKLYTAGMSGMSTSIVMLDM